MLAGLITIALIAGFLWVAENAYNGVPFLSYRIVYVSLPNVGHLEQHNAVDIAGVHVGQVLNLSTRRDRALIELQLRGVGPLPVDSRVVVRAQGLLGTRYVEIVPGSSSDMLPNGGTITETNAATTYTWGVPEALNLFDQRTRIAIGRMINGLGQGVAGQGTALNQAVGTLAPSGRDFDIVANAILTDGNAAARLLPDTDAGVTALNGARAPVTSMLQPAADTADAVAAERVPIDHALDLAPGTLHNISAGLAAPGEALLGAVGTFASAIKPVLPIVPAALGSTTTLLQRSGGPISATRQVFDEVPRAVPGTLEILTSLKPDLAPLQHAFSNLVPTVSQLAIHGCDLQNFFTGTRSLVNFGTLPGGHWGPNVGFPLTVIAGPHQLDQVINTGGMFPLHPEAYPTPCEYSPGATINDTTMLSFLGSTLAGLQ